VTWACLALVAWPGRIESPPSAPLISAAPGTLPTGVIAFEERVKRGEGYGLSGSGFFLGLTAAR
jgi:hypothetical protein